MKLASLSVFALALAAQTAQAAPVQWTTASGGNGHWYELIFGSDVTTNWSNAKAAAEAMTHAGASGYLATITSAAEQAFLDAYVAGLNAPFAGQVDPGAWLGGSDAANEGTWTWVTEPGGPIPMTYTNWASSPVQEPNDGGGFGTEDYLQGWRFGEKWNDMPAGDFKFAYMVEYTPAAVPVPAALPMLGAGIAALVALRRRKKA